MAVYTWEAESTTYKLYKKESAEATEQTLFATIEGIKSTPAAVESDSGEITLTTAMLDNAAGATVKLTNETDDANYTLKLDTDVAEYGATISSEAVTVSNGTATLTGTLSAGWDETTTGTEFTYKAEATGQTLATVTGLGDGATTSGTGANVSYAEKKITLKKGALGKESAMQLTPTTGITGYTLALEGASENKVGFEDHNAWELAGTGNAKYRTGKTEGWTLSDNKVTYTPANITDVVTISGLSDDITVSTDAGTKGQLGYKKDNAFVEGVTFGSGDKAKEITLVEAVLGKSEAKDITVKGEGYTLKLASGIKTEAELTEPKLDFTGSTPTVTGKVNEYWTVAGDTSIKYKAKTTPTLATISGLGSKADTGNVTAAFASGKLTVTVKEAALGTSTVTLTPRTAAQVGITGDFSAEFNLIKNDGSAIADNKVGLDDGDKYWAYQGTTAYYRYDTTAGFTFDSANKQKITYTAAKTGNNATTLATITNLTTNLSSLYVPAKPATEAVKDAQGNITTPAQEAKPASITGITVSDTQTDDNYVITLNKDVLGTDKNNATTLDGDGYILALGEDVTKTEQNTDVKVWTFGTNNATLTSSKPAYWILDTDGGSKKVTYTAEADKKTLATVTGLKELDASAITDSIVTYEEYTPTTATSGANVTEKGKIKLKSGFLDGKNVKLVSSDYYTLALDGVSAPAVNPTWSINGTTATYSGAVTAEGYEVKTDGSEIVYTPKSAEGQKTTVATITGLKSGLTTASADTYFKFGSGDKAKEITVSKDALGASNISVTGTNYTLALPTGIKTGNYIQATNTTPAKIEYKHDKENVWRLTNSTTAVYKQVTPAYYTLDESNNTSIIYTAEADATVKKTVDGTEEDVPAIYATVSGLKSGVVENNGQIGTKSGDVFTQGIKIGKVETNFAEDATGTVLQMSKAVLGTGTITVANGDAATAASKDYKFVLIDSENPGQQEDGTKTWEGGNGTFKYVGSLSEGWTLDKQNTSDTVDNKITYKAAESAHVFATVENLSSDVTAAALNDASTGSNYLTVDSVDNVITLKAKALGGKDISVTGNDGYTLALDSTGINTTNADKNIWAVATDGTTYTYKTVEQDFYAYAKDSTDSTKDDKTKIKYTAQKDKSTIATFAGLKSGLLDNDGTMTDITVDDDSTKKFTVTAAALDEKDVTISNLATGYTVEGSFGTDNLKAGTAYWDLDGTTAKYQHDVTAGYTYDNTAKKITYAPETTVVEAEIAGLKSGLKVSGGKIDGINIASGSTEFKLDASKVLTTTDATLKNTGKTSDGSDAAYTLALDSYTKPANGTAWVVKGTTATLVNYAPEFYAAKDSSNNKGIVYTKAKVGTADYSSTMTIPAKQTLATIEGLKSGLKPDATGQIDGLTVNASAVQLSKNVLGTTNVKITKGDANSGTIETLALDSTGDANHRVAEPIESGKWSVKNGVPTYTSTTAAGYKLDESTGTGDDASPTKGQIVYSPQKVIKVTVNGLDKVAANTEGTQVGKASGGSYYGITSNFEVKSNDITGATESLTGTLKLGKDVLNKKNVTVSTSGGTADVTFELDAGVAATTSAAVWNKAKGKTVATYTETTAAGYSLPTDNKKVIYSSKATTKTLATVTGLKKDLVPTNGELTGVTILPPVEEVKDGEGNVTTAAEPAKIQLSKEVLNTSNVTLGKNDNYWLQLADDYASTDANVNQVWTYNKSKGTATVRVGTTEGWAIKQTTQKVNNVDTLVTDHKTIVYKAAKYTNVATVSGLSKKLTLTDGHIEGLSIKNDRFDEVTPSPNVVETGSSAEEETPKKYKGTISITSDVLNNATVKVEVPRAQQSIYSFEFEYDANDIKAPTDGGNYWRAAGKGTATYQFDTSAGYTPNNVADPTVLTYSKAKTTVHATLSGLSKKVTTEKKEGNNVVKDANGKVVYTDPAELPGIEVTLAEAEVKDNQGKVTKAAVPGTITLKASAVTINPTAVESDIFTNKVTLKNGKVGDYNLNIDEIDVEEAGAKWTASGTTATYKDYDAAGYTLDTKTKKTATFVKETAKATLATVKGIKKLDATDATAFNANPATYVSVEGDKITLTSKAVGTSTISLTQGKDRDKKVTTYYFDTNVSTSINPRDAQTPYWTFSKGTATLKQLTEAGYTPNDDTKPTKFVYSKGTTATLATVKGLSTTLAVPTAEQIEKDTTTGDTKLTTAKLYATKDSGTKDSKGKAIYVPNAEDVVATYDETAKTITLNKDAFNKKTVTVTVPKNSDQYTLKLGDDLGEFANYTRNTTGWTVSGTTATYRNYNQLFYTPATDGKSIVYTAETKSTTYATVTGLKEDIDASILNESGVWTPDSTNNNNNTNPAGGGVLKLDGRHLGTATVKLTTNLTNTKNKDSFALALSTSTDTDKKVTTSTLTANSSSVTADNGKAIIKGKVSEGFAVEFGGKQITYTNANAAKKDVTIATVTGLKNSATVDVSGSTITLDNDDLTTKNVSVVTSKGNTTYTLIYSGTAPGTDATNSSPAGTEAAPNNPSKKTPGWTISKNNGTLKGYVTQEGFTKSASGTTLTYTAKTVVNEKTDKEGNKTYTYADTATLATIKGLNDSAGLTAPTSDGKISLSKNDIKGSSVTINGGTFAVEIDSSYKDKTINGSAGADNITANGTGLTINTGKGDDNITLGTSSRTKGNTLVYSTGDGNDVVANFDVRKDKLHVKKGTATVEKVGSDFIVRVGTGSIKLTNAASIATELTIINNKGTEITYSTTSTGGSPLLVDDNYFTDPTQISEIVKPFEASFTPYDFNTNFNLTKEESFVPTATYTNKK